MSEFILAVCTGNPNGFGDLKRLFLAPESERLLRRPIGKTEKHRFRTG
jgi:hypothetical protein